MELEFIKGRGAVLTGLAFVLGVVVLAATGCGSGGDGAEDLALYGVERGPLTISITENGSIQNREKVVIQSEVEGRNTIVFLEEEGKMVQEGDLLVRLDSSGFEDARIDQEIDVQNAEASLIQARENLAIVKNQSSADIEQARLDLKFAEIDLKKYKEGEYPMELQNAESEITLAEEELKNSEDQYEWSKKLAEKGYITEVELKTDELAVERKQISLETARGKMGLLRNYTYDEQIEKLRSDVEQARMALERVERKARADVVNAEAGLRAREAQFDREQNKLSKINEQIEKCTMRAPHAGMVVYAQSESSRWRGNAEPLDVGQEVTERQELIHLPKTSKMNARIQVKESSLPKIREGLPVVVKVEALDDLRIGGVLSKIAIMPDATRSWLNPDLKFYNCEVELEPGEADLRAGMSCSATIIIEQYKDVLYCPIQSVVRIGGKPHVYLLEGSQLKPHPVEIGLDNNRMVHIVSGLKEGDRVSLAPPLDSAEKGQAVEQGRQRAGTDKSAGREKEGRREGGGPQRTGKPQ